MIVFNSLDEILNAHIDDAVVAATGSSTEASKAMEKIFAASSVEDVANRFKTFPNDWYRHEFGHFLAEKLPELYVIKNMELYFKDVRICSTNCCLTKERSELTFLGGVKMDH